MDFFSGTSSNSKRSEILQFKPSPNFSKVSNLSSLTFSWKILPMDCMEIPVILETSD